MPPITAGRPVRSHLGPIGSRPSTTDGVDTVPRAYLLPWFMRSDIGHSALPPSTAVHQNGASPAPSSPRSAITSHVAPQPSHSRPPQRPQSREHIQRKRRPPLTGFPPGDHVNAGLLDPHPGSATGREGIGRPRPLARFSRCHVQPPNLSGRRRGWRRPAAFFFSIGDSGGDRGSQVLRHDLASGSFREACANGRTADAP